MAGISDQGFAIKRMTEILSDLRAEAVDLFTDLLEPGDQVDTSSSSALGRLIALISPSLTDLWEVAQADYQAFDPNSATGIALDNLVALGGITRQEQTYSTAQVIISGDNGTLVSSGLTVGSSIDSSQWTILSPVALSPSQAVGVTVTPTVVSNSTLYSITYTSITTSNTINFTTDASATAAEIIAGLNAVIVASHPSLVSSIEGTSLKISRVDEFSAVTFTVTANLGVTKVQKLGEVQSSTVGEVTAEAHTLNVILTPQLGWDSVTNPQAASPGRNLETDEELRLRFRETKFERASNILEALYSALINLEGVEEVRIYENDTDVVDAFGVPAHSFMPIILGGVSIDIANAIWQNKPMGIRSYGDTIVVIFDTQGFSHNIGFERPDPEQIYITVNLTTDREFPGTGVDDIKSALIAYFDSNLGIGDDVIWSRLFTPINTVKGHEIDSLFIGTSPSPTGTDSIAVAFDSIASLSSNNIIVNT